MAERRTLDAIERAELILQVDTARTVADPFKLTSTLSRDPNPHRR